MGIFDFLTADKKEEKLMQEKTSRAIAIAVSYTAPEELGEDAGVNFGKAVFKLKKDQAWENFEVILREDVGAIVAGDQWIVKLDEDFTRIVTPQLKLSKDSQYSTDKGYCGKYADDFFFTPAAHFVMMVDRAHFKDTFAVCSFEIKNLENNTECFTGVDKAHKNENFRTVYCPGHSHNSAAEEHTACITHKYFCRVEVPYKEACTATCNCYCKKCICVIAVGCRNNHKSKGNYK